MAHFAKIENGTVTEVIVVSNDDCGGGDYPESEPIGQTFLASLGLDGLWLQCSYHANFRGKYPATNWLYDADLDQFVMRPSPPAPPLIGLLDEP